MSRAEGLAGLSAEARGRGEPTVAAALLAFAQVMDAPTESAQHLLDTAEGLRHGGDGVRAAMTAWRCLDDFPASAGEARRLLHELDETIPGLLFDNHVAWVSTRAIVAGGSWLQSPEPKLLPTAWDIEVLGYFSRLLEDRHATTFVDVGANSGSFALLGTVHPGLVCHAAEPNPTVASLLRHNVAVNDLSAVTMVHECAFSDVTGTGVLGLPTQTGLATLGTVDHMPERNELTVQLLPLDDLVEQCGVGQIDAIKVDTEGHELLVLRGAVGVIERWRPVLLLEAVDTMMGRHGYSRRELHDFLDSHHYSVRRVGTEDIVAFPK